MSANPDKLTRDRIVAIVEETARLQIELCLQVLHADTDREALDILKRVDRELKRKPRRTR